MPSAAAMQRGAAVAESILQQHRAANNGAYPSTVSVNLWGLDAIKTKVTYALFFGLFNHGRWICCPDAIFVGQVTHPGSINSPASSNFRLRHANDGCRGSRWRSWFTWWVRGLFERAPAGAACSDYDAPVSPVLVCIAPPSCEGHKQHRSVSLLWLFRVARFRADPLGGAGSAESGEP